MEYKILETFSASEMEKIVTQHLKDGWQVAGGLHVVRGRYEEAKRVQWQGQGSDYSFFQAVFKPSTS